ncbi:MAG: hypothetical protein Q8N81_07200, partial [bacterium]|nr:hypothetical protein [bacterium]
MKKFFLFGFITAALFMVVFFVAYNLQLGQNGQKSEVPLHYSVYSQKDFFYQAFDLAPPYI